MLVADVGPSRMQPIISLHDFGDLGGKIITPSFSPLQYTCWFFMLKIGNKLFYKN
jgi:hypothetical protein